MAGIVESEARVGMNAMGGGRKVTAGVDAVKYGESAEVKLGGLNLR